MGGFIHQIAVGDIALHLIFISNTLNRLRSGGNINVKIALCC